jgi:hypothetical protein
MKNIELAVSNISLNVGCPIRVYEGKAKPKRVHLSLGEWQVIPLRGDATDQKPLGLLFGTLICLP